MTWWGTGGGWGVLSLYSKKVKKKGFGVSGEIAFFISHIMICSKSHVT